VPIDRVATLKNAEKLVRQGKLDRAVLEYVRVVEDNPGDWNTANLLGDMYARLGQNGNAIEQFRRIADRFFEDGFYPKAAAVYKKVLKLSPADEHALLQSAHIAGANGLVADARRYLKLVEESRRRAGDQRGLLDIAVRRGAIDLTNYAARLDAARARVALDQRDQAVKDFKAIAAELEEKGQHAEALDALREAAGLGPGDLELRSRLARTFLERGDTARAAEYPTEAAVGDDPQLLLRRAGDQLRNGNAEEGTLLVRRVLDADPSRHQDVAVLGWSLAGRLPDVSYRIVEAAARAAIALDDWGSAAAVLQEFVTLVPNHIPALQRLVEVCVDGGLEATMSSAQAQLADAQIAAGSPAEARFIAEDLVAREPWDRANIERFRRVLALTGEPNPDAVIAERLSGESPFLSTDLHALEDEAPAFPTPSVEQDLHATVSELTSPPVARGRPESVEVDLSIALDNTEPGPRRPSGLPPPAEPADIEGVFAQRRDEASGDSAADAAEHAFQRGLTMYRVGAIDDCMAPLKAACSSPRRRFESASLLGRIFRERGALKMAVQWFERALEGTPASPAERHEVLYDLAEGLESAGEAARALATYLALRNEAGEYRDLALRIDRLSRVRARG